MRCSRFLGLIRECKWEVAPVKTSLACTLYKPNHQNVETYHHHFILYSCTPILGTCFYHLFLGYTTVSNNTKTSFLILDVSICWSIYHSFSKITHIHLKSSKNHPLIFLHASSHLYKTSVCPFVGPSDTTIPKSHIKPPNHPLKF